MSKLMRRLAKRKQMTVHGRPPGSAPGVGHEADALGLAKGDPDYVQSSSSEPLRPVPPAKGLDSTVGVFGYLCLCLNVFFFSPLFVADPWTFHALTREDNWVENLTAVWFLLAGLLLLVTALVERSFFRRCVYILGGVAMVFAAGEEISWGSASSGLRRPTS